MEHKRAWSFGDSIQSSGSKRAGFGWLSLALIVQLDSLQLPDSCMQIINKNPASLIALVYHYC